jgi:hypothetical protein
MDLKKLNSATKYPSIFTYHGLGEKGGLTEDRTVFDQMPQKPETVHLTEKVDGTNGRIVFLPDGDYFIGSREELLYAKGDRVLNPVLSIVETLKPLADRLSPEFFVGIHTMYLEVYGGKIGGQAKQYSSKGEVGYRLFDMSYTSLPVLDQELADISSWRDNIGPGWFSETGLQSLREDFEIPMVPRLGAVSSVSLPTSVNGMYEWLKSALPGTNVALDAEAKGVPEGIVLRTADRSVIAKARFQDYERTLKRRK